MPESAPVACGDHFENDPVVSFDCDLGRGHKGPHRQTWGEGWTAEWPQVHPCCEHCGPNRNGLGHEKPCDVCASAPRSTDA